MSVNNNHKGNIVSNKYIDTTTKNNESKDVVDFVHIPKTAQNGILNVTNQKFSPITSPTTTTTTTTVSTTNNYTRTTSTTTTTTNTTTTTKLTTASPKLSCNLLHKKRIGCSLYGDCEVKTSIKSSLSTLEKLPIFKIQARKKSDPSVVERSVAAVKDRPKFTKSASIARLLGNTYNTKKQESETFGNSLGIGSAVSGSVNGGGGINNGYTQYGGRPFSGAERFQKSAQLENENIKNEVHLKDFSEDRDLRSAKAFRTISRSLGKLLRRRTHSVDISAPDPEYKVSYLGNVLTGWAKGEGCVEKPLNTLWRNYTQNNKPDVIMRIRVCASGLKATTRQHGLTEYWAHRITHCCSPKNYPRVFCWIYRHEGRKLKHEMRCHAVLCSKESVAQEICNTLRENLDRALRDFKREKLSRQNARLSLANAAYENPSLPRRKILLSVGGNNYRPPLERSKSAPKLMAIEEAIGEEEGEEIEETNEPEMRSCCQKDSLYPAMTLGRRRCRRGHSIRRTGKQIHTSDCKSHECPMSEISENNITKETSHVSDHINESPSQSTTYIPTVIKSFDEASVKAKSVSSLASSDEDDLDKVLISHDYNSNSPLAGELLSYFEMALKPKTSSLTNLQDDTIVFEPTLSSNPKHRTALSLDNLDSFSDCGEDCADEADYEDESDDVFYQESAILSLLQRNSINNLANICSSSNETSITESKQEQKEIMSQTKPTVLVLTQQQQHFDSDEGSISSGCETASTVTANMDDTSLKYIQQQQQHQQQQQQQQLHQQILNIGSEQEACDRNSTITNDEIRNHNDIDETTDSSGDVVKISSTTINFKLPRGDVGRFHKRNNSIEGGGRIGSGRGHRGSSVGDGDGDVSDSEFSDESGYVEFQDHNILLRNKSVVV